MLMGGVSLLATECTSLLHRSQDPRDSMGDSVPQMGRRTYDPLEGLSELVS